MSRPWIRRYPTADSVWRAWSHARGSPPVPVPSKRAATDLHRARAAAPNANATNRGAANVNIDQSTMVEARPLSAHVNGPNARDRGLVTAGYRRVSDEPRPELRHGVHAARPRPARRVAPDASGGEGARDDEASPNSIGQPVWALSRLAPDVGLVGLVDQVGAELAVTDQPSEQRRAKAANTVHAVGDSGPLTRANRLSMTPLSSTCSRASRATASDSRGDVVRTRRYSPSGPSVMSMCAAKSPDNSTSATCTRSAQAPTRSCAGAANACSSASMDSRSSERRARSASTKARSGAGKLGSIDTGVPSCAGPRRRQEPIAAMRPAAGPIVDTDTSTRGAHNHSGGGKGRRTTPDLPRSIGHDVSRLGGGFHWSAQCAAMPTIDHSRSGSAR